MEEIRNYLNTIRRDFSAQPLNKAQVDQSPIIQFKKWLEEAISAQLLDPYAMVVSTVSEFGNPSSRVVYLRDVSEDGMVFYTNYNSAKSKDMLNNPHVALLFHWAELNRQVRISGVAKKMSAEQSDAYFRERPRESQLGAWASEQSSTIDSRADLEERVSYYTDKFKDFDVPRPDFWGGYVIKPTTFEFWQGRPSRLHDRIFYKAQNEKWVISRVAP
jgi:pyridoxamine 5'-phosphate oxidase